MRRVRLVLEYDGTDFAGWQRQPGERTVQSVVEDAVGRLLGVDGRVPVTAAGRTDAGVHARGQVALVEAPRPLPLPAWSQGLTGRLPPDVAVVSAEPAAPDFDPRRSATGKRYVYRVWNAPRRSPLRARFSWWVRGPLDVAAMGVAAAHLLGEHDFKSFQAAGCAAKTTVRRLDRLTLDGVAGGMLTFTVEGTAFLRFMVRNLVGTLVEMGHGRLDPGAVQGILAARDRDAAGPTAPPQGLTLDEVYYGPRDGR